MKLASRAEVARNIRLQKYYRIGAVNVICGALNELYANAEPDERKLISGVLTELYKYDSLIRKRYHKDD